MAPSALLMPAAPCHRAAPRSPPTWTHPRGRRNRHARRAERPPQLAILGAVAEKLLLRRVHLLAIPTKLAYGGVESITVFLQLLLKLLELVELLLLLGAGLRCSLGFCGRPLAW
jgi:hypothetical protein